MNDFISKLFLFVLPFVLVAFSMELLLRKIPNDYNYKMEYLSSNSDTISKLFLGSSHTYFGINPDFISGNVFNASHISQSIDIDYEIIKKYDNWQNLKYIIIPIDYFTLFSRLSNGIEHWRIKNYNLYYNMHLSSRLSDNLELPNASLKSSLYRMYSYYIKKNTSLTCSKSGFGTKYTGTLDLVKTGKSASLRHTKQDLSLLHNNLKILEDIVQYALKNNVEVLLYTSPAYKTYVSNLNKNQLDLTIKNVSEIALINENCTYFNLLQDKRFTSVDFRDADHLNHKGAKKLSLIINDLLSDLEVRTHNNVYKK